MWTTRGTWRRRGWRGGGAGSNSGEQVRAGNTAGDASHYWGVAKR
jgi:hypothetical protein